MHLLPQGQLHWHFTLEQSKKEGRSGIQEQRNPLKIERGKGKVTQKVWREDAVSYVLYFMVLYIYDELCMLELTLMKNSVLKVKVGGFFFSFWLKVDSSSSDIPGFTFLAQYPEARFRDGHGHHSINVFYGQAAAGGRLFFMLSGRVQHGHLLGVKTLTAMLSLMGTFCNETKIYKDVCEESFLLHMVRT